MKKWMLLMVIAVLMSLAAPAMAGYYPSPTATPRMELIPSDSEVKVFASPSMKANIVGYIITGGRQTVDIEYKQGDWYYVSFTSVYGVSSGWIPVSCFRAAATPTPLPQSTPAPGVHRQAFVVNDQPGYRLNLRAGRSAESESLGKYYTGTPLRVFNGTEKDGYVQVVIGSRIGYMDMRYLTDDPYAFVSELPEAQVVNGSRGANLRLSPSLSADLVGWYPTGTTITVMGVTGDGWYHVAVGGQTGFMDAALTSVTLPWQYGSDSDNPAISGSITGAGQTLYVATAGSTRLNLRARASADSPSLGRFWPGTPVTVVSYTRTGWVYVRIGALEGYMDAAYLSDVSPLQRGVTRIIRNPYGTGLNLRVRPDTSSDVLQLCPNGTFVTVLGELKDDWCYVIVGDQAGYMLGTRLQNP